MHATVSTTQAATANVNPKQGWTYEYLPTAIPVLDHVQRGVFRLSTCLSCSSIPIYSIFVWRQIHQLDIWAARGFGPFLSLVCLSYFARSMFFVVRVFVGVKGAALRLLCAYPRFKLTL
jgi:hypothetical protein